MKRYALEVRYGGKTLVVDVEDFENELDDAGKNEWAQRVRNVVANTLVVEVDEIWREKEGERETGLGRDF